MKRLVATAALAVITIPMAMEAQNDNARIAAAVLAAPERSREGATVVASDAEGNNVLLRQGTNDTVCLADDPSDQRFSVACYHKALEPYMARGRQLKAQGISEHLEQRWSEIEGGTLEYPDHPATLWVLTGTSFDAATREVADSYVRSVIYHAYASEENTGIPGYRMSGGLPWLMNSGKVGAHIMISPPRGR